MMLYELDKTEKEVLKGKYSNDGPLSRMNPRPGEKVEKFYCPDCEEWHEGSVLGGPIVDSVPVSR